MELNLKLFMFLVQLLLDELIKTTNLCRFCAADELKSIKLNKKYMDDIKPLP